ncbi:MAG: hypothetical protein ACE14M_12760 [Terriglobales bacterium]
MLRMRNLVAAVLLCCSIAYAAEPKSYPDLSGNWALDPVNSTADPIYMQASRIVITQSRTYLQFEFRSGQRLVAREYYTADGKERPRYSTRLESASAKAIFQKGQLVITTRSALDNEGLQQYTETDRWYVSPDGKTLTNKMSDGKLRVYQKKPPEPEPAVSGPDNDW